MQGQPMWACGLLVAMCRVFGTSAGAAVGRFNGTFEPRVSASSYDPDEARSFTYLSSVTYCDYMEPVENWTCDSCVSSKIRLVPGKIITIDGDYDNSSRVLVGKLMDAKGCVIAFRGTETWFNMIRDAQAWHVKPVRFPECDGCLVHNGFYTIWSKAAPRVTAALGKIGCAAHSADSLLYLTGHSMGASIAHLAMFDLHASGYNVVRSYTFEAARVGNGAFAAAFKEQFARAFPVFRITHNRDPVIHAPPMALGYEHVQTEVFYDATGKYKICNETEDPTCSYQFSNIVDDAMHHIQDHCNSPLPGVGSICYPRGCLKDPTSHVSTAEVVI